MATGLVPAAGTHGQACLPYQPNSGPLLLPLRWFVKGRFYSYVIKVNQRT